MGWGIGPVKKKHIHYEKSGYQCVNRVVIGLNVDIIESPVSPLYFNFPEGDGTDGVVIYTSTIEGDIKYLILSLMLCGRQMSPQIFQLLAFRYTSIAYTYDYLDAKLHSHSRVQCLLISSKLCDILMTILYHLIIYIDCLNRLSYVL